MFSTMSTINNIPSGTVSPRAISLNSERPRGYSGAQDVRNRAAVTRTGTSPVERQALNRLDQALRPGQAPKTDVPRGFYLDITV